MKVADDQQTFVQEKNEGIKFWKHLWKHLSAKYQTKVSRLSLALLYAHNDLFKLESELTGVLDWVPELVPTNYHGAYDVIRQVNLSKNKLKLEKSSYQDKVNAEIRERDLTEEKMKTSSILGYPNLKFASQSFSLLTYHLMF